MKSHPFRTIASFTPQEDANSIGKVEWCPYCGCIRESVNDKTTHVYYPQAYETVGETTCGTLKALARERGEL